MQTEATRLPTNVVAAIKTFGCQRGTSAAVLFPLSPQPSHGPSWESPVPPGYYRLIACLTWCCEERQVLQLRLTPHWGKGRLWKGRVSAELMECRRRWLCDPPLQNIIYKHRLDYTSLHALYIVGISAIFFVFLRRDQCSEIVGLRLVGERLVEDAD